MQSASDKAKRQELVGGCLQLARTEHARRIAIEQQAQQHLRRERLTADRRIPRVKTTQVQQANHADDKPRQMVERQTVADRDRLLERVGIVDGLEFAGHGEPHGLRVIQGCASLP